MDKKSCIFIVCFTLVVMVINFGFAMFMLNYTPSPAPIRNYRYHIISIRSEDNQNTHYAQFMFTLLIPDSVTLLTGADYYNYYRDKGFQNNNIAINGTSITFLERNSDLYTIPILEYSFFINNQGDFTFNYRYEEHTPNQYYVTTSLRFSVDKIIKLGEYIV